MNKNIENDTTQKSKLKATMAFTQSFCEMLEI
jgi:hypothetical protein